MIDSTATTPRPRTLGSERVRLARVAQTAALGVPGVVGTDAGPQGLFVTAAGDERLEGVTSVALPEGTYEVSLQLVCALVPLYPLADRVRAAVRTMAAAAGLPLGSVVVNVTGVADPGTA